MIIDEKYSYPPSELGPEFDNYRNQIKAKFGYDIFYYPDSQAVGGFGDEVGREDITRFPLDQILKGIQVEFEHTNDTEKALKIALDHLTEVGGKPYYDYLDDMEKKMDDAKEDLRTFVGASLLEVKYPTMKEVEETDKYYKSKRNLSRDELDHWKEVKLLKQLLINNQG